MRPPDEQPPRRELPPRPPGPVGKVPVHEYHLRLAGREWTVLHSGAVLSYEDEWRYLGEPKEERAPYGVALWPASIALAHEVVARAGDFAGRRVLELGAGTGLPGIVAASLGARVVQTDRQEEALALGRRNVERNGAAVAGRVEHRRADWTAWSDAERYDWILAADVLYAARLHPHLRRILETNLAPGGRVLLADPFRESSFQLLGALEEGGWGITFSQWSVEGAIPVPRPIAVYELTPPPR